MQPVSLNAALVVGGELRLRCERIDLSDEFVVLAGELALFRLEVFGEALERRGAEQMAEDLRALFGLGGEHLAELALGDHDDLRELGAVYAEDVDDRLVDLALLGERGQIRGDRGSTVG